MTADLQSYLQPEWAAPPDWLVAELRRLCRDLRAEGSDTGWLRVTATFREAAGGWAAGGALAGNVAAATLFVAEALEAALTAEGAAGGAVVLGYVLQLTLSEEDWARFLAAVAADRGVAGDDDGPVRLATFPTKVMTHFAKRGRHGVVRDLYRLVRGRIDALARCAMRDATDFDDWIGALALLAAQLTMRRWLPLTIDAPSAGDELSRIELSRDAGGEIDGGRFVAPPQRDHPALAALFDADEIRSLHRREAYAAECFAHLFAAFCSGDIDAAHQVAVHDAYRRRLVEDRLAARQWLALGKSRFEIAPYI